MDQHFLLTGILLGFSIAAPVGPIGVLCIRRSLQYGRLSGFVSGLGAAVADTVYGIVAAFSLTLLSDFLLAGQVWLRFFGGAFLMYLGIKTFLAKSTTNQLPITHKTLLNDFVSTFFLTVTNPMTIFSFVAIFSGLGLTEAKDDPLSAAYLVLGIFIGSSLWWLLLSEGVTFFRKKISQSIMIWINRSAGFLIALFGLLAWLSLLR